MSAIQNVNRHVFSGRKNNTGKTKVSGNCCSVDIFLGARCTVAKADPSVLFGGETFFAVAAQALPRFRSWR